MRACAKMDGATALICSSDKGCSERSTGDCSAKRDASCMVFLQIKLAVEKPSPDSLDSEPLRASGGVGMKNLVGLVATVFPEFIARDGSARGAVRKKRQGWCGPQPEARTWPGAP